MHASSAYVKAAFEAGGTGYVLKSGLRDDLPDAVQSVLDGLVYLSPGLSKEYPERIRNPLAVRTDADPENVHGEASR